MIGPTLHKMRGRPLQVQPPLHAYFTADPRLWAHVALCALGSIHGASFSAADGISSPVTCFEGLTHFPTSLKLRRRKLRVIDKTYS